MSVLTIPLAFLFLAAILLWLVIGARGWWSVKLLMMAISATLSFEIFQSLQSYMGWPKHSQYADMPAKLLVYDIRVVEPSAENPGAVYLWAKPEGRLSLYVLPYSRSAHKEAEKVKQSLVDGDTVEISFRPPASPRGTPSRGEHTRSGAIEFYVLPPSSLPPKVGS